MKSVAPWKRKGVDAVLFKIGMVLAVVGILMIAAANIIEALYMQ